ncbi:kinase-like domain-containing protein [Rhizophagus irregularis DAOM 181602=DAOM 197198]|nr:kinase-like domain-containing protein [Rhizophagus irregularis DAOM 181602=DAOM 197198]
MNLLQYIQQYGRMVHYDMIVIINKRGYSRKQSKKVNLKLYSSQNINNEFLNEAKVYFERNHLYGISQNPYSKNYIMLFSGNEKIDSLIQEKQLGINKYDDIIIEWISYDKFDDIKELRKDEFSTIYSAIWKDGPLQYDRNKREYSREQSI